jgi:hypothetical protein
MFSIERRAEVPFVENTFFSNAPLRTREHVELVKAFEDSLIGLASRAALQVVDSLSRPAREIHHDVGIDHVCHRTHRRSKARLPQSVDVRHAIGDVISRTLPNRGGTLERAVALRLAHVHFDPAKTLDAKALNKMISDQQKACQKKQDAYGTSSGHGAQEGVELDLDA